MGHAVSRYWRLMHFFLELHANQDTEGGVSFFPRPHPEGEVLWHEGQPKTREVEKMEEALRAMTPRLLELMAGE